MSKPTVFAARTPSGWITDIDYSIALEPSPRRVRAVIDDVVIADSIEVMLLREQGHLPVYYFPRHDVREDLLVPTTHSTHCPHKGDAAYWTIDVGARTAVNAVWGYPNPSSHLAGLDDYLAFYWNKMDRWYEEDEEVFVHARDPHKRVDVLESERPVQVVLNGEVVAESTQARFLFETSLPTRYYIPQDDVRMEVLAPSETRSRCPYKGLAVYWSATVAGKVVENVVWSYPDPIAECPRIKGRLCFFNEVVDDILVDGEPVPKIRTAWSRD